MKRALQAILIAGEEMKFVLANRKKITIREGHRDYTLGPVLIGCNQIDWATMREITVVKHCTLVEVTPEEYQADGFETKSEMLNGLAQFYPDINWESPVTVIKWEDN
jgi:hypothetical protein